MTERKERQNESVQCGQGWGWVPDGDGYVPAPPRQQDDTKNESNPRQ